METRTAAAVRVLGSVSEAASAIQTWVEDYLAMGGAAQNIS